MSVYALVAASDFAREHFAEKAAEGFFDCVVAVDGGFVHVTEAGVVPDVVLGDFDSLGYTPQAACLVEHPTHKDASDLELALEFAFGHGASEIFAYGCLGGRVDHTLAALQTLAAYAEKGMAVCAVGPAEDRPGYGKGVAVSVLSGPARLCLEAPDGLAEEGAVSVHAACDRAIGVSEGNMEYPLCDSTLTNRTSLGLSNELLGRPAWVQVAKGTLFVVHPAYLHARRAIL